MTLQTLAMVLRQSVVFSSGRVLFCKMAQIKTDHRKYDHLKSTAKKKKKKVWCE